MPRHALNLTRTDRLGYVAGGLALFAWGLRRPGVAGGGAMGAGAWLLYQAYTGDNPLFRPLGIHVNPTPAQPGASETIVIDETVTINAGREAVYEFWRELENLPRVAPQLESVERRDEQRSVWRVRIADSAPVEWESEITRDEPGSVIAWRTTHQRSLTHFGDVQFREAAGGRGTVVAVHLEYVPPAGSVGTAVARLIGQEPRSLIRETLRRMRQLIETGEVATARDASSGDAPDGQRFAIPLGWVSLGLGAAEVGAPRMVARLVGAPAHTALVRALGARELASGAGILARRGRAGWLWSRVGGDIMDLALLAAALSAPGANRRRIAGAAAAVAGIAALDYFSSRAATREQRRKSAPPLPRAQSETLHASNVR